MTSYLETLDLVLPAETKIGQVRRQVLDATHWSPTPTTSVSYVSSNRVLIVADVETGQRLEAMLPEKMLTYLALPSEESAPSSITNGWNIAGLRIEGYLGRFQAFINNDESSNDTERKNLGKLLNIENGLFDQIVDCSVQAQISAAVKPPGYYHAGADEAAQVAAMAQIPELIGEFEKPRYFNYDPDICAHGSSGINGCIRCIEACPTEAIISIGEKVEINPYLCQGGGSCTSACPSGAITYTYPKAEEQIECLRHIIHQMREQSGNRGVSLLVYDIENGRDNIAQAMAEMPEHIVPFAVEEIGSVGLDIMACALAYGASQVLVYTPESTPQQVCAVVERNLDLVGAVLEQLAIESHSIQLVTDRAELPELGSQGVIDKVATFAGLGNKRGIIRAALGYFNEISKSPREYIDLPDGSLFGQVSLDIDACTLCMACVSVCPGKALQDGGDSPALKLIEANCLQCGICASACPEQAITLQSRLHFDHNVVNASRPLKEEQPFHCVRCNKPFATQSIIGKMTEKLKGHWMFENPEAVRRLKMCEDCRVKDMFSNEGTAV